jgi:hypothetical protein
LRRSRRGKHILGTPGSVSAVAQRLEVRFVEASSATERQAQPKHGGDFDAFHLAHHSLGNGFGSDVPFVIGQGLLYAAPLFLGVLAGLFSKKPVRMSLVLVLITLLTAAPLLFGDLLCLIVIVPICVIVAPLVAFVVARFGGPGSRPPGARGAGLGARTSYRPLALPRSYFEPVERYLGSVLQRTLLAAYARSFERELSREGDVRVVMR